MTVLNLSVMEFRQGMMMARCHEDFECDDEFDGLESDE
jgi:hypothetical protein